MLAAITPAMTPWLGALAWVVLVAVGWRICR